MFICESNDNMLCIISQSYEKLQTFKEKWAKWSSCPSSGARWSHTWGKMIIHIMHSIKWAFIIKNRSNLMQLQNTWKSKRLTCNTRKKNSYAECEPQNNVSNKLQRTTQTHVTLLINISFSFHFVTIYPPDSRSNDWCVIHRIAD